MRNEEQLPFCAVRLGGYPGLHNGYRPTGRCCAPGCGDKVKEEEAVAVIFPFDYVWRDGRYHRGEPRDGSEVHLLHDGCEDDFERGWDGQIPAIGRLVWEG